MSCSKVSDRQAQNPKPARYKIQLSSMVYRGGQTIPSMHPGLIPRKGAMAGNLLVVGVSAITGHFGLRQDMLPGIVPAPTTSHTVRAYRAHQAAPRAGADEQIRALGDRGCVPTQAVVLGV